MFKRFTKKLIVVFALIESLAGFSADLPEVMLLGDSIRMGYQPVVMEILKKDAVLWAPAENCKDSVFFLENVKRWCEGRNPKVIYFNVGLHDIYLKKDGSCIRTEELYVQNLQTIAKEFKATFPDAVIIFGTSTVVDEDRITTSKTYGKLVRRNSDIDRYNQLAVKTLNGEGVLINDLNGLMKRSSPSSLLIDDGTHLNAEGKKLLGSAVASKIRENLQ